MASPLPPEGTAHGFSLDTISTRQRGGVLSATFRAPPMNLIGPEVVRDLATLLDEMYRGPNYRVVVFDSADPDSCSRTWTSPRWPSSRPKLPSRRRAGRQGGGQRDHRRRPQ